MQMLLRQGAMGGRTDGRELDGWLDQGRKGDEGQMTVWLFGRVRVFLWTTATEPDLHWWIFFPWGCHVSVLGHITPRSLIKSRPPSGAILLPGAPHLSPSLFVVASLSFFFTPLLPLHPFSCQDVVLRLDLRQLEARCDRSLKFHSNAAFETRSKCVPYSIWM